MTLRAKFEGRQCILLLHDLSGAILLVVGGGVYGDFVNLRSAGSITQRGS